MTIDSGPPCNIHPRRDWIESTIFGGIKPCLGQPPQTPLRIFDPTVGWSLKRFHGNILGARVRPFLE